MSLAFTATAHKVNCGSNAVLDNIAIGTLLVWHYPTSFVTDVVIFFKGDDTGWSAWHSFGIGPISTTSNFNLEMSRATQSLRVQASDNLVTANVWNFDGVIWTQSGADAAQKLYHGSLSVVAAEVGSYGIQRVGSGAFGSNAAYSAYLGNDSIGEDWSRWRGRIAWVGIWNRQLTLGEIIDQQFRPHVTSGCVLFMHLGRGATSGAGTQPDLSGNLNNGTVTGATVAEHVPIGR